MGLGGAVGGLIGLPRLMFLLEEGKKEKSHEKDAQNQKSKGLSHNFTSWPEGVAAMS